MPNIRVKRYITGNTYYLHTIELNQVVNNSLT